jgi:glycosyltransferase involved in cell wall biosynthesis
LAVVEAMACGCVPVVSNVGPLPEIVENGISGILVPPNDPQAIREALEQLHRDHLLWARLSQAARERIEQHFTWDRVVDRCLKAYQMFRSFRD